MSLKSCPLVGTEWHFFRDIMGAPAQQACLRLGVDLGSGYLAREAQASGSETVTQLQVPSQLRHSLTDCDCAVSRSILHMHPGWRWQY